jgi:hypothetical protein
VDIPVAGSALPGGHRPRVGFFLTAQVESDGGCTAPLGWVVLADMVDVEDAVEAMDELEFCRWAVFRGPGANILLTSSELIPNPLLPLFHPLGWNELLRGGTTAVIGGLWGKLRVE